MREIGKNVYGLGYGHGIRFDKYDNLWVVDKGTNAAVRFNPAGYVTLNLGRRPEGPDDPEESWFRNGRGAAPPPAAQDGYFRGPTDIAFDSDDNMYISDGYTNGRVAKFDKHGDVGEVVGLARTGRPAREQNPGQFNTPHNIAVDRQNNVYVADRNNRRIQVFDTDGNFRRFIFLNATYDKNSIRCSATRRPIRRTKRSPGLCASPAADAISLHLGLGAGPHLQDDPRRQDHRDHGHLRPRRQAVQLDSLARLSDRRHALRGGHEQLAGPETHAASGADGPRHRPLTASRSMPDIASGAAGRAGPDTRRCCPPRPRR